MKRFRLVWLCASIAIGAICFPSQANASPQDAIPTSPDFLTVLQAQPTPLSSLASDADALTAFASRLGPPLGLKDAASALASKQPSPQARQGSKPPPASSSDQALTAELTAQAVRLTTALATWHLAMGLREAAESEEAATVQRVLAQASMQRSWLLEGEGRRALRRAVDLMALDVALLQRQPPQNTLP
ncbi:MAG: hypothetical protein FJ246_09760, partial [Nitrospira sp.]|nr:hypothetical protein [Nitrospira sp.]